MQITRTETQILSGGRTASVVEIDGEKIRLVTSTRRRKTISASIRDGMIQLSVPAGLPDTQIISSARGLVAKIKQRQQQNQRYTTDEALHQRALHLGCPAFFGHLFDGFSLGCGGKLESTIVDLSGPLVI